jgi:hypothetical protein
MCSGNYNLASLLDFVLSFKPNFKAPNTLRMWAERARSRLFVLWRYFTRQSMPQAHQLVLDMCPMMATTSVVKSLSNKPSMCEQFISLPLIDDTNLDVP